MAEKTDLQVINPEILPPILEGRATTEVVALRDRFFGGLAELLEGWIRRHESQHTQRAYRQDIFSFIDWMGWRWPEDAQGFLSVPVSAVIDYRDEIAKSYAPMTVNRRLCSLSAWFKFINASAAVLKLPVEVANPAHPQFVPRSRADAEKPTPALSMVAVHKLLASVEGDSPVAWRDRALLYLFFYSGARIGAVAKLQVHDFTHDAEGGSELFLHEKGKVMRSVGFHQVAADMVKQYVDLCGLTDGPLIRRSAAPRSQQLGEKGMSVRGIRKRMQKLFSALEDGAKYSPHTGRATGATALLDAGADLKSVQEWLGHASITTTAVYDRRRRGIKDSASHKIPY